jgi:hypothetical protein
LSAPRAESAKSNTVVFLIGRYEYKGPGMSDVDERKSESNAATSKRKKRTWKIWGWLAGIVASVIAAVIA